MTTNTGTAPALRLDRIIFPTDFSKFSVQALRHAMVLAQRFEAKLKVIHVIPRAFQQIEPTYLETQALLTPELRKQVDVEMKRFLTPLREAHFEHQVEVSEGEPWREILAAVEEMSADLVVMGTHGSSGFERFLLGSVTEKLMHRLPCPVMTVCHEEGKTWEAPGLISRILCATDFGETATESLRYALAFAEKHKADITLLHVIENAPQTEETAYTDVGPLRQDLQTRAEAKLRDVIASCPASAGAVTPRVAFGRAYREILRAAAEDRADLIVIGAQGGGRLEHLLSGSNAQQVVRAATCPVLTVRERTNRQTKPAAARVTGVTLA